MYLDGQGNVVPDMSTIGYQAIGVPARSRGWLTRRDTGKIDAEASDGARHPLARDGFVLDYDEAKVFHDSQLAQFPSPSHLSARRRLLQAGDVFKQPDLARTLERIADNPDDFYHGSLARELAASLQKGGA